MFDKKAYMKKYNKQYYIDNQEYYKKYAKQYREDNPEYLSQYYKANREKGLERTIQWQKDNPEKRKEHVNRYLKNKRKINAKFNLNYGMVRAVGRSLKGNKKGRHWEDLVGYTLGDLIKHLKRTIPVGYIWEDYLGGKLHVDHIIPKSVFNFTKPEHVDFKRCWALNNLRLLPARENLMKGKKIDKPFQPALAI